MQKSQANRSVIARRARPSTPNHGTIPLGSITTVTASGHVKRSRAMKMTGAQKNSEGRTSEWNMPIDFFTCPKWDQTVTAQRT